MFASVQRPGFAQLVEESTAPIGTPVEEDVLAAFITPRGVRSGLSQVVLDPFTSLVRASAAHWANDFPVVSPPDEIPAPGAFC